MKRSQNSVGLMGHVHLECGSGEHAEDKLKWGEFLKADWDTWHGRGLGGPRGGGRIGSRSRGRGNHVPESDFGRGRGMQTSWRFNALPLPVGAMGTENELADTGTSPNKNSLMEVEDGAHADALAKRRLNLVADVEEDNLEKDPNAMRLDGVIIPADVAENLAEKDIKKRSKKDVADSPSLGSAASREESVRSQ
jgi:hypothetical protein